MNCRGFTLLEMILVLVILGIASVFAVPAIMRPRPVGAGARLTQLRGAAIRAGRAGRAQDTLARAFPVYATPDGLVMADSEAWTTTRARVRAP